MRALYMPPPSCDNGISPTGSRTREATTRPTSARPSSTPGKIATELLDSAAEGPGKEAARKAYAAEAIPTGAIADAV